MIAPRTSPSWYPLALAAATQSIGDDMAVVTWQLVWWSGSRHVVSQAPAADTVITQCDEATDLGSGMRWGEVEAVERVEIAICCHCRLHSNFK